MDLVISEKIYPYIGFDKKIADGAPGIQGTRITVRDIAGYYQLGMTVDEILNTLSHLTPSQVHSALAYYFDHQEEIDNDMTKSNDIEYWKSQIFQSSK
jgi:uncharacterized protein (DUF433 family)